MGPGPECAVLLECDDRADRHQAACHDPRRLPAWYVEVLVPSVFDFSQCDGGQLVLWQAVGGDVRYALGPGELDRLWVVEVDGTPIVVDAASR